MSKKFSQWSLVVQRVSQTHADIWIGNISSGAKPPFQIKLELLLEADTNNSTAIIATKTLSAHEWQKPFQFVSDRFYKLCVFDGLIAQQGYCVKVFIKEENEQEQWQFVEQATFVTLPKTLPLKGQKPFTVALGSCFANHDDNGQVSAAYTALYENGPEEYRPDITFLVGDQVYLDIGFASLIPFSRFIRNRIANRYAKNWKGLSGIFTRGGTWMLPDDHEYWNDYPFNSLPILALHSLKIPSVRNVWETAAIDGASNIQSSRMVEIINIGDDISICIANFRSKRSHHQLMPDVDFAKVIAWAKNLQTPGVLIISQTLIDSISTDERNILSFGKQYTQLIEALAETGNDILVLTGDVHFGRISSVQLGTKGTVLTEVISSPLSNLKGLLNGFGCGVACHTPKQYPDNDNFKFSAVPSVNVNYDDSYKVSHQKGMRFTQHPTDRTDEHFVTIGFNRITDSEIELNVQSWRVKICDPLTGLPSPGFSSAYKTQLRRR